MRLAQKTERKQRQVDMLHGSLLDKILLFALPLAASSILQQLFNSADMAVVGHFAGHQALAAVGGNTAAINLLTNLFIGLSVGANVVIGHFIGLGRKKEIRDVVHTVISVALISGGILLVLGQFLAKPILLVTDAPLDVLDLATVYLRIYFFGMPFFMLYNFGSAILRSKGDTKRPLYALLLAGVINVGLNLLLVIVFRLGVAGVGIATVLSNSVSAGLILYFLCHDEETFRLDLHQLSLNKDHFRRVFLIGAPAGLQGMVFSLSNVFIQTAINSFGSDAMAGSAAAVNFEFFTYFVVSAFSQAAVTFTSQNFGAGDYQRCRRIFRICTIGALIGTLCMSMTFVLFRAPLIRIYTPDPGAVEYALVRVLRVEIFACLPSLYEVPGSALRGMNHSLLPAVLTVFGSCVLWVAWLFTVFQWSSSFEMLLNVYPVTWVTTAVLVLFSYFFIRRREFQGPGPKLEPKEG